MTSTKLDFFTFSLLFAKLRSSLTPSLFLCGRHICKPPSASAVPAAHLIRTPDSGELNHTAAAIAAYSSINIQRAAGRTGEQMAWLQDAGGSEPGAREGRGGEGR